MADELEQDIKKVQHQIEELTTAIAAVEKELDRLCKEERDRRDKEERDRLVKKEERDRMGKKERQRLYKKEERDRMDAKEERDRMVMKEQQLRAEKLELLRKENLLMEEQARRMAAGPGIVTADGETAARSVQAAIVVVKGTPSSLGEVKVAEPYLPDPRRPSSFVKVAFFGGRPCAVPLSTALPLLLVAPEFGLLHEAAYGNGNRRNSASMQMVQAAEELCTTMCGVFPGEKERQDQFIRWHNHWFALKLEVPQRSSCMQNDGHVVVTTRLGSFTLVILEVKNELGASGDPYFQAQRYYQLAYTDGQRWNTDIVVRASRAPAFLLDLVGPNLVIHGVAHKGGNVVICEPLTPRLLLLPLHSRQPEHREQLARVLEAYSSGVSALHERITQMVGPAKGSTSSQGQSSGAQQPELNNTGDEEPAPRNPQQLAGLLQGMSLSQTVAPKVPGSSSNPTGVHLAAYQQERQLVPYPLLGGQPYSNVERLRQPEAEHSDKLLFTCDHETHGKVVVKFTLHDYPAEIHYAWARADLAPRLFDVVRLPSGWRMVVMEHLRKEDGWDTLDQLPEAKRIGLRNAVATALEAAHKVQVLPPRPPRHPAGQLLPQPEVGDAGGEPSVGAQRQQAEAPNRPAVHGDVRPPNVAVRLPGGQIRFLDLDWAGLQGMQRYPHGMNMSIDWHKAAGPGKAMHTEHDLDMAGKL